MADNIPPGSTDAEPPVAQTAPLATSPGVVDDAGDPDQATAPVAVAAPSGGSSWWQTVDRGPQAKPWRVLSIVLLVLGCVLAPIGVTAGWAKNLVVDQQAYLDAVDPLITDPAIVNAAEARLVAGIDDAITKLNIADKIGTELESLGLPPKLATLATTYLATFRTDITNAITNMVDELVTSPKVATVWHSANATLHTKFVQIMRGDSPGKLHSLNVDLSAAVTQVKEKLETSGVSWAAQIPDVPVVIDIAGNANVQRVAGYYNLLDTLGSWLPIIAALLLLLSILIAPSRLGGLAKAAGWLAVSMVVLIVLLVIGRNWLISKAPLQPEVTQAFVRQLTVNLQSTIRLILISGAVIAVVAWLFGRSRSAVSLRSEVQSAMGSIRDSRWHIVIRALGAVVALILVLVLISWDNPGVLWAVVLALLAGLAAVVAISPQPGNAPPPDEAQPQPEPLEQAVSHS